jgi:hypothetical protein
MTVAGQRPFAHRCSLCGHRFAEGDRSRCASCVLPGSDCHLVRCPRCGHEFPSDSRLLRWLGRFLRVSR